MKQERADGTTTPNDEAYSFLRASNLFFFPLSLLFFSKKYVDESAVHTYIHSDSSSGVSLWGWGRLKNGDARVRLSVNIPYVSISLSFFSF